VAEYELLLPGLNHLVNGSANADVDYSRINQLYTDRVLGLEMAE
jgi:hypothetical protein